MMKWDLTLERHIRIMKKEEREEGRQEGRQEGRLEGRQEGRQEGDNLRLIKQIQKKVGKGKNIMVIADELETDEEEIRPYYEEVVISGADCDAQEILDHMMKRTTLLKV